MGTLLFINIRKSQATGLKTYFYLDQENNEIILASYMMKTSFTKKAKSLALKNQGNNIYTPMGEGLHAIVYARYNPNSLIVRKHFKMDYQNPFNPHRLRALMALHTNKKFQNLADSICVPFLIENKPKILFLKKILGVSLQEISLENDGKMKITKYQIMSLLNAIIQLADEVELKIVHTDIHAGNILMTNEGRLVLIDFDECVSHINKFQFRKMLNSEYIENPTDEDYLNGYDDEGTSKCVTIPMDVEEEEFYQTEEIYENLKEESLKKFRNIFLKNGESLFNDKEFSKLSDDDSSVFFDVEIKLRDSDDDFLL